MMKTYHFHEINIEDYLTCIRMAIMFHSLAYLSLFELVTVSKCRALGNQEPSPVLLIIFRYVNTPNLQEYQT